MLELRQHGPVVGLGLRGTGDSWDNGNVVCLDGVWVMWAHFAGLYKKGLHMSTYRCFTLKKKKRQTCSRSFSRLRWSRKLTRSPFLLPRAACPSSWGGNPLRAPVNAAHPPLSKAEHGIYLFILSLPPRTHIHTPPLSANHCDTEFTE